jgi:hypothetical protein
MLKRTGSTCILGSLLMLFASQAAFAQCLAPRSLTGAWKSNDGGTYYIRQIGNDVWWLGMSGDDGRHFTNVYKGVMSGNSVSGSYADVPRGSVQSGGVLNLTIVRGSGGGILEIRKAGGSAFGGSRWSKPCDDHVLTPG